MSAIEPDSTPSELNQRRRAWLASILLRSQHSWFGRFTLHLRRLTALGRGQRRRLERKAAVSLAGAALVLSMGAGLMTPRSVYAASINVEQTSPGIGAVVIANDGDCSLPEAIINANNNAATNPDCAAGSGGTDTINLPAFTLFDLPSINNYQYYSDNGLPAITTNITIEGNNSIIARRTSVPTPDFRIMVVTATGRLTLNDASIVSGYSIKDGGGLYVGGGYALLNNVTFQGNYAKDDGGAVEVNRDGTLILDDSLVDLNDAGDLGGGIAAETGAILTIRNDTQITGNYASEGGGGLSADESGLVTIDGSTISGNEGAEFGGGIHTYKTTIDIENESTISNNHTYAAGGGADLYLSTVTITDSTISGNGALLRGAGLNLAGSEVTIERSLIHDNDIPIYSPNQFGGGIFNGTGDDLAAYESVTSRLTIIESTISDNGAVGGAGIFNYYENSLTIQKTTVSGNEAIYGGGLANLFGSFLITNSTFSGNTAAYEDAPFGVGGAIISLGDPEAVSIFNTGVFLSTITGNSAAEYGGGIYNAAGIFYLGGNIVSGNTAAYEGSEIYNPGPAVIVPFFNILGHSGETTADALFNVSPSVDDVLATSDGSLPTALTAILETTLDDNGGPTDTHALVADSPAIDVVPSDICDPFAPVGDLSEDQRGYPRPIDIVGTGSETNRLCDSGAYEVQLPVESMCPVDSDDVGEELTSAIGVGQGSPTKGFRTRKLTIPNSDDVVALYGQLAALETGVMKYVRFLPQGEPKVQLAAPTSAAYRTFAVDWWGSDLPTDSSWVKGQFFWGLKGNKSPRAFVLWPTYETEEAYANVFATFDDSATNHVAWEAGFIPTQTQTLEIPETQAEGATINVTVALVDVNKDNRPVLVTVEAGDVSVGRTVTQPNKGLLLNLEEFELEDVAAGVDEVTITLESPLPSVDFPNGGDSAAMIGAAANYACETVDAPPPAPRPDSAALGQSAESSSFWNRIKATAAARMTPFASQQSTGSGSRFIEQMQQLKADGGLHRPDRSAHGRD